MINWITPYLVDFEGRVIRLETEKNTLMKTSGRDFLALHRQTQV